MNTINTSCMSSSVECQCGGSGQSHSPGSGSGCSSGNNRAFPSPSSSVSDPPGSWGRTSPVSIGSSASHAAQHFDMDNSGFMDAVPFPYPPRRNVFIEPGSGMRDVPMWLKNLRLHKYTGLFQQLNYDGMMNLTERQLEQQDLMEPGGIRTTMAEMKQMITTPIRPYPPPGKPEPDQAKIDGLDIFADDLDEENLPAHFTRVLGRLSMQMFSVAPEELEDDCYSSLLHILDRCINHEAFTQAQKRRVIGWKQMVKRIWYPAKSARAPYAGPPGSPPQRSGSWNKDRRGYYGKKWRLGSPPMTPRKLNRSYSDASPVTAALPFTSNLTCAPQQLMQNMNMHYAMLSMLAQQAQPPPQSVPLVLASSGQQQNTTNQHQQQALRPVPFTSPRCLNEAQAAAGQPQTLPSTIAGRIQNQNNLQAPAGLSAFPHTCACPPNEMANIQRTTSLPPPQNLHQMALMLAAYGGLTGGHSPPAPGQQYLPQSSAQQVNSVYTPPAGNNNSVGQPVDMGRPTRGVSPPQLQENPWEGLMATSNGQQEKVRTNAGGLSEPSSTNSTSTPLETLLKENSGSPWTSGSSGPLVGGGPGIQFNPNRVKELAQTSSLLKEDRSIGCYSPIQWHSGQCRFEEKGTQTAAGVEASTRPGGSVYAGGADYWGQIGWGSEGLRESEGRADRGLRSPPNLMAYNFENSSPLYGGATGSLDINSRMEKLCRSVAEVAIGGLETPESSTIGGLY